MSARMAPCGGWRWKAASIRTRGKCISTRSHSRSAAPFKRVAGRGSLGRFHSLVQRRAFALRRYHSVCVRWVLRTLGHRLSEEQDTQINLLERLLQHARATAEFNVYYGKGRDAYDVRGRVAHESLFNVANGTYRGPNSQQGYSPFTTWTRGLAWAMLGFAEQIEFLDSLPDEAWADTNRAAVDHGCSRRPVPRATSTSTCGVLTAFLLGHRGTGAGGAGDWQAQRADPFNDHEPVDSSAAAIGAQGLLRLGHLLDRH